MHTSAADYAQAVLLGSGQLCDTAVLPRSRLDARVISRRTHEGARAYLERLEKNSFSAALNQPIQSLDQPNRQLLQTSNEKAGLRNPLQQVDTMLDHGGPAATNPAGFVARWKAHQATGEPARTRERWEEQLYGVAGAESAAPSCGDSGPSSFEAWAAVQRGGSAAPNPYVPTTRFDVESGESLQASRWGSTAPAASPAPPVYSRITGAILDPPADIPTALRYPKGAARRECINAGKQIQAVEACLRAVDSKAQSRAEHDLSRWQAGASISRCPTSSSTSIRAAERCGPDLHPSSHSAFLVHPNERGYLWRGESSARVRAELLAAALEGQEMGKLTYSALDKTSLRRGDSDSVLCDLEFNYEVTKKLEHSHRYELPRTTLAEATAIDSLERSNPVILLSRELANSENLQNAYMNGKRLEDNAK